jgi:hypothetical protein
MGKDEKNIRRIMQGKSTFEAALQALRILGVRPSLSVDPRQAA